MKFSLTGAIAVAATLVATTFAVAQDQSRSFKPHKFNGPNKPAFAQGVWSFQLQAGGCSSLDYGDGRGESHCVNGNIASRVMAPKLARPGNEVEYYMEFRTDPSFRYDGGKTPAYSKIEIAEWGRTEGIKNHLYDLQLDTVRGLTFERHVCVAPRQLAQWNSFRLRIRWSKSGDGYLEASCNGKVVLSRTAQQTVIPPDCGATYKLQCDPSKQRPNGSIYWQVGPRLSGYGPDFARYGFSSQFAPFPPNGIKVQIRNLYVGKPRAN